MTSTVNAESPYELKIERETGYLLGGLSLAYAGWKNETNKSFTNEDLKYLNREDIPSYDRSFAGNWDETAILESDLLMLAAFATPAGFLISEPDDFLTLTILYAEMVVLTYGGVSYAKGTNTRIRPFAYGEKAPSSEKENPEITQSFFSGHAAHTTAGFVFAATVFTDYYPDSEYLSTVWAGAIVLSAYGSWARVRGGKHFPSDVITGCFWGGLVGYTIPTLHRKEGDGKKSWSVLPFRQQDKIGVLLTLKF